MMNIAKYYGTYAAAAVMALATAYSASAAPIVHYTSSGVGSIGAANAGNLGGYDLTLKSAAIEVRIDYTPTVSGASNPIILWDFGGSGTGAALVLDDDQLHFFASNSTSYVVTGNHGLTATQNDVPIVATFEINASGSDDVMSLYVAGNPTPIATNAFGTNNDWAGGETGSELGEESGTQRYNGTGLFNYFQVVSYPETNITLNLYDLDTQAYPDNTLANILVPEPTSAALVGFVSLFMMARRRRIG